MNKSLEDIINSDKNIKIELPPNPLERDMILKQIFERLNELEYQVEYTDFEVKRSRTKMELIEYDLNMLLHKFNTNMEENKRLKEELEDKEQIEEELKETKAELNKIRKSIRRFELMDLK